MPISLDRRWARFLDRTRVGDDCWEWTGPRTPQGYGICDFFRLALAHRVSWHLHNGPIPTGLCVLHRCDNPPCVRPSHLFLGTRSDNAADKVAKNRQGGPPLKHPRERPCDLCGTIYEPPAKHRGRSRTCSDACRRRLTVQTKRMN